jgi:hypothetical protein
VNRYLLVTGDFNGDGNIDQVRLLRQAEGSKFGVFAFICGEDGAYAIYRLTEDDVTYFSSMGIEPVLPGSYVAACGKGYASCEGEPREIHLRYEAINYFKEESANSFFYWDSDTGSFKRVWISD